jgi:hypothetical protein
VLLTRGGRGVGPAAVRLFAAERGDVSRGSYPYVKGVVVRSPILPFVD